MKRLASWCVAMIAAGLLGGPAAGRLPAGTGGPNPRLGAQALGEKLQKLHMGALLETLADQTGDRQLRVEALLFRADADEQQRDRLLQEAADSLREQYEELQKTIDADKDRKGEVFEEQTIRLYKLRLRYIEVQLLRGKPYIDSLLFLLGGDADRKALGSLAAGTAKMLEETQRSIQMEISDSREDPDKTKMVYLVPELEDLLVRMNFTGAQLRYYAALVLPKQLPDQPNNPARERLLNEAVKDLKPFVDEADYGVQPYASLLQGRCYRELGQFDKAAKLLAWAAGDQSSKDVLVESLFEIVRNFVEQGAAVLRDEKRADRIEAGNKLFQQAQEAVETFAKRAPEVHPQLGVDVKQLVLSHYLYEQWADALRAAGQADQAAEKEKLSQQAFLTFLTKYKDPGVQAAVGRLFREKFRGKGVDTQKLDPVIVLLLAILEMNDAMELQGEASMDSLPEDRQRQIAAHLQKAEEMFQSIRTSKAPSAAQAVPEALWNLGVIFWKRNQNFESAEMFRELITRYPQHERAYNAALNAVNINSQLIADQVEQNKAVSQKRRLELVESIRLLLKHWPKDKEAAKYHYDLAYQCEKLAETAEGPEKKKWIDEAVAHYDLVPDDSPLHDAARFYSLDLSYQQIMAAAPGEARTAQADKLADAMTDFGRRMYESWQKESDAGRKEDFGRFGSTAEFHAEVLGHDVLDRKDESLAAIEKLPDRWPNTAILQECREFAIRSRLAKGDVQQALRQFEEFQTKYGAEAARGLMQEVVNKLRLAIQELQGQRDGQDKLNAFRQAYLAFAKEIFSSLGASAEGQQKYFMTLLYADALTQSGAEADARTALGLLQGLQQEDQRRQDEDKQRIQRRFEPLLEEIRRAGANTDALAAALGKVQQAAKEFGLKDWRSSWLNEAQLGLEKLKGGRTEGRKQILDMVRRSLTKACEQLSQAVQRGTTMDVDVTLGLARAHETLKQYPEALEEYRKLTVGLDPNTQGPLYWQAELGYCRTLLEGNRNDPKMLEGLVARIDQLRAETPDLGGPAYRGKINQIDADARAILQK